MVVMVVVIVALAACDGSSSGEQGTKSRTSTSRRSRSSTSSTTTSTTRPETSSTTGATATTTSTAPGTCGAQSATITAAIEGSDVGGLAAQRGNFTVQRCRIAASNPIWAAANTVPNDPTRLDTAIVVLQRIGALWTVMDVGTADVGCMAPVSVQHDLALAC